MSLRLLVVEGNTREGRDTYREGFGLTPSESYSAVLGELAPDAACDIAFPADEGANLPDPAGLDGYDGIVLTGSALHIWEMEAASRRQVELMRAVYRSGVPAFGSCWGLQVGAAAAGGDVALNPRGREVGFAREIVRTEAGRSHAMLQGRPDAFTAPAVHLDIVLTPPTDVTILAANALTPVQAAEIRHEGGTFWGVQYHPEFSLVELASILKRMDAPLSAEGFGTPAAVTDYADDLDVLARDPVGRGDLAWRLGLDAQVLDPVLRTAEIANFLGARVRPHKSARGRA